MNNFKKSNIILKMIFYFSFLNIILYVLFFLTSMAFASPNKAVIGPISLIGEISQEEKQIIFNHFREKMNIRYHLISHKMLELISEHGIDSFDIEDCTNSSCVRKILIFLNNLRNKYDADDLFLLQLVRNKSETQLSLKFSSLSIPEITKNIVNKSCNECDIKKLKSTVDKAVKNLFVKLGFKESEIKQVDKKNEMEISEEKVQPLKNYEKEKDKFLADELFMPEENLTPEPIKNNETDDKGIAKDPIIDPYIVDRDIYNQNIGRLLTDVTYALQIFRSGMFVQIELTIDPSGTVVNQKIIKSSGSNDFDETAIMILEEIQFEPLPDTMLKFGNYVVNLQIHNSR